jgi:hypothetical protein
MGVTHFSAVSSTVSTLDKTLTGNATLTNLEGKDVGILKVNTALTSAVTLTFPVAIDGKILTVRNVSTAGGSLTVKVSGKTGISVAGGKTAILGCDADDFFRITADA